MSPRVGWSREVARKKLLEKQKIARIKELTRAWKADPIKKKKFYQLSEAVTLFAKGLKELAKYYPLPRGAIKQFEDAVRRGDIVIMIEPGAYLEKSGRVVTMGRIIYSPAKSVRVIQLPKSAFDEYGNLRPQALLNLWHELTHTVRSFVPQLEKLPTAYDEATTNFIADRLAMLFAAKGVKGRHLKIDPVTMASARLSWRRNLVYKPEIVERIFEEYTADGKLKTEYKKRLLEDFARGLLLKRKVRETVMKSMKPELASSKLREVHLTAEAREYLRKNYERLLRDVKRVSAEDLERAREEIRKELPRIEEYFWNMKKGKEKFGLHIIRKYSDILMRLRGKV